MSKLNNLEETQISEIEKLINQFREEELPDRNEPFHFEAEISSGLDSFINWLKNKK